MRHHDTDGFVVRGRAPLTRRGPRAMAAATAIALGATLLTACADSDGGSTAGKDGLVSVTVGSGDNIFDLPMKVADAQGYFRKHGLKVKFVSVTAATGPAALQSGSVQFLNSSPTGFLSALAKGVPEVAIGADGLGNPLGIVVSKKFADAHKLTDSTPGEQVAKALAGSTGGASSANTKAEASTFLKSHDVDPGKVKWVSLPSPAANKAALTSGQIDWFITSEPTPLSIQQSGDGVVVVDPERFPDWTAEQSGYGELVVARKDYVGKNAATAKKFVAAIQDATAYMNAHVDDTELLDIAKKAMPGTADEVLRDSLKQPGWPTSAAMKDEEWQKTLDFVNGLGVLTKKMTVTADNWTNEYAPAGGGS